LVIFSFLGLVNCHFSGLTKLPSVVIIFQSQSLLLTIVVTWSVIISLTVSAGLSTYCLIFLGQYFARTDGTDGNIVIAISSNTSSCVAQSTVNHCMYEFVTAVSTNAAGATFNNEFFITLLAKLGFNLCMIHNFVILFTANLSAADHNLIVVAISGRSALILVIRLSNALTSKGLSNILYHALDAVVDWSAVKAILSIIWETCPNLFKPFLMLLVIKLVSCSAIISFVLKVCSNHHLSTISLLYKLKPACSHKNHHLTANHCGVEVGANKATREARLDHKASLFHNCHGAIYHKSFASYQFKKVAFDVTNELRSHDVSLSI